jgi:hypothetical protein
MENTFNATFWITISGIISALIIAFITAINKSKCITVECCGLKCIRDVAKEVQLEEHKIDVGLAPEETPKQITF